MGTLQESLENARTTGSIIFIADETWRADHARKKWDP